MRPKVGPGDRYLNDAGMTRGARRSDRLSAVFFRGCGDGLPDKLRSRAEGLWSKPGAEQDAAEVERAMEWSLL